MEVNLNAMPLETFLQKYLTIPYNMADMRTSEVGAPVAPFNN
jgi:hypothetical protein